MILSDIVIGLLSQCIATEMLNSISVAIRTRRTLRFDVKFLRKTEGFMISMNDVQVKILRKKKNEDLLIVNG